LQNLKKIILTGHQNSVTSVDGIFVENEFVVVTASADSTIRLFRFNPDEVEGNLEASQVIQLKNNGFCFCVKLFMMPKAGLLLAFSTDDDKIHLYSESNKCFNPTDVLKGHEDWVRGLDFILDSNSDVLLASSSQDSYIRLWRFSRKEDSNLIETNDNLLQVDERILKIGESNFILTVDSVLQGHENWVYSIHWKRNNEKLNLLSSSMDKSMIIWEFDNEIGTWIEKVRVGDVGGNNLGFYGAKFNSSGKSIVGHGFMGSLHLWHQNQDNEKLWEPGIINGGHFREVRDIAWEPKGEFLFSISMDQTTRIHAQWKDKNTFHEIARPQVHGYDMQCLAVLSRYRFASAAEEKIVRTFQATGNFVENLRSLVGIADDNEGDEILKTHQKGASVPSLGLSNKAVYDEDLINQQDNQVKFKDEYPENYFVPMNMTVPPTEEYLTQNTLWPELQKLYAHGYELYSLAATKDGKLLASACKSTSIEHSEIILWDTNNWKILQRLRSHKLTVTQMKFSSDGRRLLSVSRDRRWTMFENKGINDEVNFEIAATVDKNNGVHDRIIWTCCWSNDDKYFATGSRDGKVVIWTKSEVVQETSLKDYKSIAILDCSPDSVTALSISSEKINGSYLIASGFESGLIQLHKFDGNSISHLKTLNNSEAHHLTVNKLEFCPKIGKILLASCGNDHIVKIHELK
jgi:elongator complex protein 2